MKLIILSYIIALFSFLIILPLQAQKIEKFPLVYFTSLNELGVGVNFNSPDHKLAVQFSGGYVIPFANKTYYESGLFSGLIFKTPFLSVIQRGPVIHLATIYNFNHLDEVIPRQKNYISLDLSYAGLKSGEYKSDPGRISGDSDGYSEFSEEMNSFGIGLKLLNRIDIGSLWFATFGAGIKIQDVTRHYTLEGNYNDPKPSSRVEKFSKAVPNINIGMVYYFSITSK
jgi:hypothetical protein